jgi:type II secretory pathway component PulF
MRQYLYTAVTAEGKAINGVMEALDESSVQDLLQQRGLYPVSIRPGSRLFASLRTLFLGRRVKRIEVIEFAQNLSVMIRAGVSIMSALDDIIETTQNRVFHGVLCDIRQSVGNGSRFADAVERHDDVFPDIFIRLVRVGEETGQFEGSLAEVAEHLKKIEELRVAIKQALIYPVFAIVTTLGALMFWMVYVLPKVTATLKGLGGKLPLLTRWLMACSDYSRRCWYLYLLVPIGTLVVVKLLRRKGWGRYHLDQLSLRLPVVRDILLHHGIALFAEQMRILIRAGLTIDRSFTMVAEVIGNEVFRRSLLRVREKVVLGGFIADALKAETLYPVLVVRMVSVGENSGTLDSQFAFLADHYRARVDTLSAGLGKVVEPLVIVFVGLIFAVIILGLMLPVYDLVSQVGGGGR